MFWKMESDSEKNYKNVLKNKSPYESLWHIYLL